MPPLSAGLLGEYLHAGAPVRLAAHRAECVVPSAWCGTGHRVSYVRERREGRTLGRWGCTLEMWGCRPGWSGSSRGW